MLTTSLALLILAWPISVTDILISFGQFGPSTITYMTLYTLNYFLTVTGESWLIATNFDSLLPLKRLDKRKTMKITKLEKKKRLYLLELDSDQTCYITEDTIVRFMLTKDKEISPQEFAEIQTFAQFSYGKNLALYHLSFKARTEKEVRDYLVKHEIDEKIIPQVIQALKDDNWINDRQYAYAIINSNQLSGDKGSYMLIQKISQKGVAKAVIQEVLQEFDLTEVAERTAEKLLKKYQGKLPARALQDKIIQNLTNKGFSYSEAKTAFDQLDNQVDEETVQELIFKELDKQYRKYSRKYEGYELKQRLTQVLARKGYDFSDIASALREYL